MLLSCIYDVVKMSHKFTRDISKITNVMLYEKNYFQPKNVKNLVQFCLTLIKLMYCNFVGWMEREPCNFYC